MDKKYQLKEELKEEVLDKLKEQGMLEKTIEKFLDGKEIKECEKCLTPNMYLMHKSKMDNILELYECYKCNKVTPYRNNDKST